MNHYCPDVLGVTSASEDRGIEPGTPGSQLPKPELDDFRQIYTNSHCVMQRRCDGDNELYRFVKKRQIE